MDETYELIPCSACCRHVRSSEIACPFCATPISSRPAPPQFRLRTRVGRDRGYSLGAALVSAGIISRGRRGLRRLRWWPNPSEKGPEESRETSGGTAPYRDLHAAIVEQSVLRSLFFQVVVPSGSRMGS
jgi:hypothetical protein